MYAYLSLSLSLSLSIYIYIYIYKFTCSQTETSYRKLAPPRATPHPIRDPSEYIHLNVFA